MSLALIADEAAEADRIELMPMLVEIGRRARAAQRVVGLASAERKDCGAARNGGRDPRRQGGHPLGQRRDLAAANSAVRPPPSSTD